MAQYNYIDKNPIQSTNYYKIVATNFDGKDHHSNIVRISHSPEVSFVIFPNPIFTDQKLNFDFGENNIEIANIKILDILGRELTNLKYDFSQKQDELKISQPGIYIIRIETESGQIFSNRILVK
ncbi:MAG: T9SS type A sorting domain-containing protein [Saprospiraceae bacterium]|nr:T9SS type A sorting domain-containing protein [Saprospiraceae bacterium]